MKTVWAQSCRTGRFKAESRGNHPLQDDNGEHFLSGAGCGGDSKAHVGKRQVCSRRSGPGRRRTGGKQQVCRRQERSVRKGRGLAKAVEECRGDPKPMGCRPLANVAGPAPPVAASRGLADHSLRGAIFPESGSTLGTCTAMRTWSAPIRSGEFVAEMRWAGSFQADGREQLDSRAGSGDGVRRLYWKCTLLYTGGAGTGGQCPCLSGTKCTTGDRRGAA